ncbi:GDSL-like Lipase/Acylhydrolase family protein [Granulicella rosea]|uniref:GDSL-like Lipase/Acylhydrolase family protein n=1 Tax=Granulicella rosea TaxID=474952 RepID=A0A239M4Z8_9BACT|nr:GDSL-type esterase/lipase family protein [Granulicella rosea]SNT37248.1 GDSL-like Lipase/Acylhydrolase family protein [Granulicella rosea]
MTHPHPRSSRFAHNPGASISLVLLVLWMSAAALANTPSKPKAKSAPKAAAVHKPGTAPHHTHASAANPKPLKHNGRPSRASRAAIAAANTHAAHPHPHEFDKAVVPVTRVPEAAPIALAEPSHSPFLYAKQLEPFFEDLADVQAELHSATPKPNAQSSIPALASVVRVLQFGDSHTAADLFTGAMRADLQTRFGDGGLGFQYPGHPFAGYHLAGSARSQSAGWFTEGNHFTALGDGALGLGGISITTSRPGEWISLSTTCTTLQVHYLRQAGGGKLSFSDNGTFVSQVDTASDGTGSAGTLTYACTPGVHEFELTTLDHAPVRLFGLVTEQPGVTWECLGINGAVATLMLRWNQTLFAEYLRQRDPSLIVLAYGTNEAAGSAAHNAEYVADFNRLLDNLHRIVPTASVLVLGPYDRATKLGRGRRAAWQTWAGTARIIEDQKESCRTHGCAYYDQRARMGGPGAMIRWASEGLAQGDHTHLTGAGYRTMADALYNDLLTAYKAYEPATQAVVPNGN